MHSILEYCNITKIMNDNSKYKKLLTSEWPWKSERAANKQRRLKKGKKAEEGKEENLGQ